MKSRFMISALAGALMCSAAMAQDHQSGQSQGNMSSTMRQGSTSDRMSVGDQIFLMHVMHANAKEIEAARIAMRRAQNRAVYNFAERMFNEHSSLQNQVTTTWSPSQNPWLTDWQNTMRKNSERNRSNWTRGNMEGEGAVDNWMYLYSSDWAELHRLENASGFAFDKMYVQMMVRDHAMLVQKFDRQNEMSTNSGVTGFMSGHVDMIRGHLDEARRLSYMYDDPFHFQRSWPWKH